MLQLLSQSQGISLTKLLCKRKMKGIILSFVLLSIMMRLATASNLRRNKHLLAFCTFFDYNKDDYIDEKEIDILIKGVGMHGSNSEENRHRVVGDLWCDFFRGMVNETVNKNGKISVEQWLAFWDDYARNTTATQDWQRVYEQAIFESVDFNINGVITEDEFVSVYNYFHNNAADVAAAFHKIAKGGKTVTRSDYHPLFMEFFASNDPEAPGNFIAGTTKLDRRYSN